MNSDFSCSFVRSEFVIDFVQDLKAVRNTVLQQAVLLANTRAEGDCMLDLRLLPFHYLLRQREVIATVAANDWKLDPTTHPSRL